MLLLYHWTGMKSQSSLPTPPNCSPETKKRARKRLNWGFGSAMSPWALCSCLSALFPRHKTGQCAFAQLHPVFIRGRAGLGRGCRAWIRSAPSCPLGQPRLFLGQEKKQYQHHRPSNPVLLWMRICSRLRPLRSYTSLSSARVKPAGNKSSGNGHVIEKMLSKVFWCLVLI